MKFSYSADEIQNLKAALLANADCEALSENEFVADLYDAAPPATINLTFEKDAVHVDAAAVLLYDEAQDGWYMGERIESADAISALLHKLAEGTHE